MMDECERLTYVSGEAACNAVDIATALGGGFHVSFPPGRGTMTYFPDGSDVSIEVGDDRAAASNSRFETVEWDIEDGIPPFCREGAPAFRRGEESRLTIAILRVKWYYVSHEPESRVGTCDVGRSQTVHRLYRPA